ncbi:MAG TPA: cytosine deaminase, partial [Candidatus Atribacteria bacterium]|nr:cytosine deaminase [Candidatus Atribacteria bacterium]
MDLLIKNAKIYGKTDLVDIACDGGKIVEISPGIKGEFKEVIDAEGNFVSSAFIDPHIHLDKVLVVDTVRPNISGTLKEAIEILWEKKRNYTVEDIVERAGKVIQWEVANGVTHIRTHVDVDTIGGLKPLEGLLATREKYKELLDLQIVAFPQEGIIQDPGTEELLYKAMEMGADVVGGMPHNEMTDDDSKRHIEILFEIAKKFDAPIDSHTDENDDPYSRTLEYLAAKTIKEGYEGRVTADHTCALSSYNDVHAAKVISLVKKADITMESNPVTNIVLEGRFDTYPKRRGLTRIKELL